MQFNDTNMIKQRLEKETLIYELPVCNVIDLVAEGVLCGSMQQLEEYDNEYEW